MLALEAPLPDDDGWAYEWKWDGWRCCLRMAPGGATLLTSRNGNDLTPLFPELTGAGLRVATGGRAVVLDGELVALNEHGRPEFGLLQHRRAEPTPALVRRVPVTYFAFDLLQLGETRLLPEPYSRRRELLDGLGPAPGGPVAVPPHYLDADPAELLETARETGLEGVVAKALHAPYVPARRTGYWRKHPLTTTQEVVVGGWRPGSGRRASRVGSLLLGANDATGALRYVGDVGTGFTERMLDELLALLLPLARDTSPFANEVPRDHVRGAHWVRPELVGEVVYRQFTRDGRLRHTSWRGLRNDKSPDEVTAALFDE